MRKYLNYGIFGAGVLLVVWLAVSHSMHVRTLVNDMGSGNAGLEISAAAELIANEQFMDSISGEPMQTREKAAGALEALGNADAVKQCIAFLKDPDKPVRDRVVSVLEQIGATRPENIKELVAGLKDGDSNVRKGTVTALTDPAHGIGPRPGVIEAITAIMKAEGGARDPGGDVLGSALFVRNGANKTSVPLLIGLLHDKDEGVRGGAADALGKIGDSTALDALKTAMHQDTAQVRRVAIGAIARIASPSGEDALTEAIRNPLDDSQARVEAAVGLGKIATPTAVTTLIGSLTDDDLNLRAASVSALARAARPLPDVPANGAVVTALTAALQGNQPTVQLGAAQALQQTAAPQADPALIAALQHAAPDVRAASAAALGFPGNTAAVGPLIKALGDSDGGVGGTARDALGAIGPAATTPLIAELSKGGASAYYAAEALGKAGASTLPALEKAADSSSPMVQRFAAVALGDIGTAEARPALEKLATNPNPDVAYAARQQLERDVASP